MKKDTETKQIIFHIHADLHRQIKIFAAMRNISMSNWMNRAINERIQKELRDDKKDIL